MCDGIQGSFMPFWPFKKKKAVPVENISGIQVYEKGSEKTAEVLADTSHTESTDYKDAMALFAGDTTEEKTEWLHHTDGYWYRKKPDGSIDPNAYILDAAGNRVPFSEPDQ
jgi:hypothetical protein